jgi:glycosyltransferase involved in cell wall biosynthesis
MANKISIVIPAKDEGNYLLPLLDSLESQTLKPDELIIIDSGKGDACSVIVKNWQGTIPIQYKRVNFAYPGKARNIGNNLATGDWLGFIDCKTIPEKFWLEQCLGIAMKENVDFVCGLTFFEAKNPFQKLLRASSYGLIPHQTLPGSIIRKSKFNNVGGFIPDVRSSEDIEWRNRVKASGIRSATADAVVTRYHGLPENLMKAIKKYYQYAIATAHTDILRGQKGFYLAITLFPLTIFVYKWNWVMAQFDSNHFLYIPHIMKLYLTAMISIYVVLKGFVKPRVRNYSTSILEKAFLFILIALIFGLIHKWNYIFAQFDVKSALYFPHINKIFLGSFCALSLLYRGVILPLKRKVSTKFIFPCRWITIGCIGLCLDLIKVPGYCLGASLNMAGLVKKIKL